MDRSFPYVALIFLTIGIQGVSAGKKTYLGDRVADSRRVSMDQIDHGGWHGLLQKYVDSDGMVDYRRLKASPGDMQVLQRYINALSSADPAVPAKRLAKLAYWINAYNAVTVHGILREYPTKSIRNHTSKFGGYNIWHDYQLVVAGKAYSLDQMEHQILRKMSEPRIHFAIVCASIGCPRLLNEAYVPERIDEQLDRNARDFFSRDRNFRYDTVKKRFYLSELLSWFGSDFGKDQAEQLQKIAPWLPTPAAQRAAQQNAVRVKYLDYNWELNEQKPKTQ